MVPTLKGNIIIAQVTISSMMSILEREVQVQGSMRQGKPTQTGRSGSRPERVSQPSLGKDGGRAHGKGGGSKPAALGLPEVSCPGANKMRLERAQGPGRRFYWKGGGREIGWILKAAPPSWDKNLPRAPFQPEGLTTVQCDGVEPCQGFRELGVFAGGGVGVVRQQREAGRKHRGSSG